MPFLANSRKYFWAVLGGLAILAAVLVWLAPGEQTLGSGIKSVYIHVALTWTGMSGLLIAGLAGLAVALFAKPSIQEWVHKIAWVALAFFAAGLAMSVLAASINWGDVFWQEPRTNSVFQILAVGLIVQVANSWSVPFRLKGTLNFLLAVFLIWLIQTTPLVLHPGDAARSTTSLAIRFTFFALFILCTLAGAWIVINWQGTHHDSRIRGEIRA
jgi:hypothetical protein